VRPDLDVDVLVCICGMKNLPLMSARPCAGNKIGARLHLSWLQKAPGKLAAADAICSAPEKLFLSCCRKREFAICLCAQMPDPAPRSLTGLRRAEAQCTRCPLYKRATQVVPGEGPSPAAVMMVGEQPGNDEDLAGHPFVGPAGRMLDRAISDAGLDRGSIFVTNAVKHFKFEVRGKRRLHKKPDNYEVQQCKWWNDIERKLVKPRLIVALGATAARSLTGKPVTIQSVRGKLLSLEDGAKLIVTVHPSALLRIKDRDDRHRQYDAFVSDLRRTTAYLAAA
jgi:DNA polymerase